MMPPGMGMTRQVALLRGINVGGHNRVEMARLRELMQGLGYGDVRTHLQSGNVLFTSDATPEQASQDIETRLAEQFGLRLRVLVRTIDELAAVVAANPLATVATDPARLLVLFLSAAPDPERLSGIDPAGYEPERFFAAGREIHLWCASGVQGSQLSRVLSDRRLGVTVTARNWNTVTRLLSLAGE
jgi:uncharacterized protein (DUF1697 family)